MNNEKINWVKVLNEQSEWRSEQEMSKWFAASIGKKSVKLSHAVLKEFAQMLSLMRKAVYDSHFNKELDLNWLNDQLSKIKLIFDWPDNSGLPLLRAKIDLRSDDDYLQSLKGALLIQFAVDLAESLSSKREISLHRCEGLYRDKDAKDLTMVPDVSEQTELLWRNEISVLLEKSLQSESEIQRCADLFPASSKSKYCSDSCRFSTFQIIKQLKEPQYLANKQRRYREKKN